MGRAGDAPFPSLRLAYSAGGPLPRETFNSFQAKFGLRLGQVYGATRDDLFRFDGNRFISLRPSTGYRSSDTTVLTQDFQQVLVDPVEPGPIEEAQASVERRSVAFA